MKKIIILLLSLFIILLIGLSFYHHTIYKENIPILAYHDISEKPLNETDVSLKNFEKQMKYLKTKNFQTLSLNEFLAWKNGKNIPGKKVVLTFDDGQESFYTNVLPILEKYNLKATLFLISSTINQNGWLTEEQLFDLQNNHPLITIASHSYNLHDAKSAQENNYNLYHNDIKHNQKHNYHYYAYPFGIKNDAYIQALKDNDYQLAFLFSPSKWSNKHQDNYQITRVPIYKNNSFLKFKLKVNFKI